MTSILPKPFSVIITSRSADNVKPVARILPACQPQISSQSLSPLKMKLGGSCIALNTTITPMRTASVLDHYPNDVKRLLDDDDECDEEGSCRKRRKLTHLTPDEKMMRRKLKNRVAAQVARDKKKAKMDELEIIVNQLQEANEQLFTENEALRDRTDQLAHENNEFRLRLGLEPAEVKVEVKSEPVTSSDAQSGYFGSAEGAYPDSASDDVVFSGLITHNSESSDMQAVFREITTVIEQASAEDGAEVVQCPQEVPAAVIECDPEVAASEEVVDTSTANDVDAIQDLIRFDHVYVKSRGREALNPGLISVATPGSSSSNHNAIISEGLTSAVGTKSSFASSTGDGQQDQTQDMDSLSLDISNFDELLNELLGVNNTQGDIAELVQNKLKPSDSVNELGMITDMDEPLVVDDVCGSVVESQSRCSLADSGYGEMAASPEGLGSPSLEFEDCSILDLFPDLC